MKGKILNKTRVAGAVMLATMGVAAGTAVQAESLLAPLIINNSVIGGYTAGNSSATGGPASMVETFITYKVGALPGKTSREFPFAKTHYHWIQKNWNDGKFEFTDATQNTIKSGPTDVDFNYYRRLKKPCRVTNDWGFMTPKDMIYQSTQSFHADSGGYKTITVPTSDSEVMSELDDHGISSTGLWADKSTGVSWKGNYLGMLVIDDVTGGNDEEGNMSGFVYIIDPIQGYMLDYKMLNDHRSTGIGDFSSGFVSKKSIDYSWVPENIAMTEWYTAVLSNNMASEDNPNTTYDATVMIGSEPRDGKDGNQSDPRDFTNGEKGVFDHDEDFESGAPDLEITCLSGYKRNKIVYDSQLDFTSYGGWTRRSITPWNDGMFSKATGAITYKKETARNEIPRGPAFGYRPVSWFIETSGHLNNGRSGNHANRPY